MAQRLKLRDQTNAELLAQLREPFRAIARDRLLPMPELRMRLEREVVINFENNDIDSLPRQRLDILPERVEIGVGVIAQQVDRAPRF